MSPFLGVCWHKHTKQWRVQIKYGYKTVYLGYYREPEDAARVYDAAKVMACGRNHGPLNFDGTLPPHIPRALIVQKLTNAGVRIKDRNHAEDGTATLDHHSDGGTRELGADPGVDPAERVATE